MLDKQVVLNESKPVLYYEVMKVAARCFYLHVSSESCEKCCGAAQVGPPRQGCPSQDSSTEMPAAEFETN